jgi:hypothetical protein
LLWPEASRFGSWCSTKVQQPPPGFGPGQAPSHSPSLLRASLVAADGTSV